jgi:hypothetical protein
VKVIETERLYLRELSINDKTNIAKVLSDPEALKLVFTLLKNTVTKVLQQKLPLRVRNMHLMF